MIKQKSLDSEKFISHIQERIKSYYQLELIKRRQQDKQCKQQKGGMNNATKS